jgi:AraC family transcriptional regulator
MSRTGVKQVPDSTNTGDGTLSDLRISRPVDHSEGRERFGCSMTRMYHNPAVPGYINAIEPHCPTTLLAHGAWAEADVHTMHFARHLFISDEASSPADTIFMHLYPTTTPLTLMQKLGNQITRSLSYPGNISLLPRTTPTQFGWDAPKACVHMLISPAFVTRCAGDIGQGDPARIRLHPVFNVRDPLVEQLGMALHSDLCARGLGGDAYATSLLHALTLHLLLKYSPLVPLPSTPTIRSTGLTPHEVTTIRDFIDDHLDESLTVTRMADALRMTVTQFRRRFKHTLHMPPHQYVIRRRVERARALLQRGHTGIAQVAHDVGFADQSHLHRHFTQILGVTPADVLPGDHNVQR